MKISKRQELANAYNQTWEEERKLEKEYAKKLKVIREKRAEIYKQYTSCKE